MLKTLLYGAFSEQWQMPVQPQVVQFAWAYGLSQKNELRPSIHQKVNICKELLEQEMVVFQVDEKCLEDPCTSHT